MEQKLPLLEEIQEILGKVVYITLDDKRKIIGKLLSLSEAAEELLLDTIPSINKKLRFYRRKEIDIQDYIKDREFDEKTKEQFKSNKYYAGSVIIPGNHITKIEILKQNLQVQS